MGFPSVVLVKAGYLGCSCGLMAGDPVAHCGEPVNHDQYDIGSFPDGDACNKVH